MTIIEDKANKEGKHEKKHRYFEKKGIGLVRYALPVGDYIKCDDRVIDLIMRKNKRNLEPKKMDFLGLFDIAIDTKKDINELITNICGQSHARFRDECILAQQNGIKLIVLVENKASYIHPKWKDKTPIYNKEVKNLNDLFSWVNPRFFMNTHAKMHYSNGEKKVSRVAVRGSQLAKACITMENKYGVKFLFCNPNDAGRRIVELLGE